MSQNTLEEWRPIDGYPNYQVSDRGRVMNLKSGRVLKQAVDNHGYECVALYKDGKIKQCRIHRLTAEAFIPNPNNLAQVNHIDENKRNNDVSNLEWVTALHNIQHSTHQRSCKINQLTLDGEYIRQWNSSMDIEREFGFNSGGIISCCKGKQKTAYGYKWEYTDGLHQQKHNRPIVVTTKDDEYVAEYKSVADASRCLKISTTQIRNCLNGRYKSTHGLRFIYND